jgi:DNA mismatch repair ATPase MutS
VTRRVFVPRLKRARSRLRGMIDEASRRAVLFLAGEIMSGTNSHDRRIAAEWVIRALIIRDAIGQITTHDLTLTEIASNALPAVTIISKTPAKRAH